MKDSLVMVSMSRYSEWQRGTVNRNRHLFEECIASGRFEKILHVDYPARNALRALRVFVEDLLLAHFGKTVRRGLLWRLAEISPRVWVLTTIEHCFHRKAFLKRLESTMQFLALDRPMVWSYVPTIPELMGHAAFSFSIFDAVDDWSAHPSYARQRRQLVKNYAVICEKANVVFTVSHHLVSLFPGRQHVFWVPNGVDVDRFTLRKRNKTSRPVVGYVGMIQERFDVGQVVELAVARPQYDFRIVGWVWKKIDVSALHALPNVQFTGFLPYEKIPEELARFSVGIIPHIRDGLSRSMNPLKLYEYLAAGVPVVTSEQPDFMGFLGVHEASTTEDFLRSIDAFIAHPPDPYTLREHVRSFSWKNRLQDIFKKTDLAKTR